MSRNLCRTETTSINCWWPMMPDYVFIHDSLALKLNEWHRRSVWAQAPQTKWKRERKKQKLHSIYRMEKHNKNAYNNKTGTTEPTLVQHRSQAASECVCAPLHAHTKRKANKYHLVKYSRQWPLLPAVLYAHKWILLLLLQMNGTARHGME